MTVETPPVPADAALLRRARDGDVRAFEALIAGHDRALRRLAYRMLGDATAMDDALQEAYVRAYRSLRSFAGDAAFGTWLYRIVVNACHDERRRAARRRHAPLEAGAERVDGAPGPERAAAARIDLAAALAALAPELAAVVLLVDAEGLSYAEAGAVLELPVGTVASRLNRARAALRPALAGYANVEDTP
jgi:RNA polymerase sigma-70 factor, ECF subfamily